MYGNLEYIFLDMFFVILNHSLVLMFVYCRYKSAVDSQSTVQVLNCIIISPASDKANH